MPERGTSRYRRVLSGLAFARVFAAGLASVAGSSIATVCLVWIVFKDTNSPLDVGLLGTSFLVTSIAFSIFGGTLVDRFDRRRLMILSDVARGLAMAVVALDLALQGLNLTVVLVAYGLVGAFTTVFQPAEYAIIPAIVEAPLLADANGLVRSSRSAVQFVGAALAGALIVTVGAQVGIVVNAASFFGSAALLFGMVTPRRPQPQRHDRQGVRGYLADLAEGFAWLRRATGFLQLTLSATFFNFCSTLIGAFIVVYSTDLLHGSALVYSGLLAAEIAGLGIGSLLVGPLHGVRYAGRSWVVPYGAVSGAVALALPLVPSVPSALAAVFVLGALGGFAGTAWLSAAQALVPASMQGRYYGIDNLGSIAILPAAQIGGAFLIAAYGIGPTYLYIALVWIACGLAFVLPRALWRLGVPPDPRDAASFRTDVSEAGRPGSPEGTPSS